jgi:hypothetical protein
MRQQDLIAGRASSPRRTFAMTIVAQDPSIGNDRGMLRATVPVPADRLEPGPRSHRFQVIDYNATGRVLLGPATLAVGAREKGDWGWAEPDPFSDRSDEELSTRRSGKSARPVPSTGSPAIRTASRSAVRAEFRRGRSRICIRGGCSASVH